MNLSCGRIVYSKGSRAGLVLKTSHGAKICYVLKFRFHTSINGAKYKALIANLKLTKYMGTRS